MATKKISKTESDIALKTLDLLQEILWAVRSREANDLSNGLTHLRHLAQNEKTARRETEKKTAAQGKQHDLKELVGTMSLALADLELFPSNIDIAKFAVEALQIPISRWEKRSRYEMIGMLIMESINASPARLREVGKLLYKISDESDSMAQIKNQSRQTGFSWNEAIRSLSTLIE